MFGGAVDSIFGGPFGGQLWFYVVYLVCLFAVIAYKPQHIRNLSLFRISCYLFGIAVVLPSVVTLVAGVFSVNFGTGVQVPGGRGTIQPGSGAFSQFLGPEASVILRLLFQILAALGPILFGISIICALISLVPSFIPPPERELFGSEPRDPGRPSSIRDSPILSKPKVPRAPEPDHSES
jgi:hypothetical protein